jgi:hypothetical protein
MDGIITFFWDFPSASPKVLGKTLHDPAPCDQLFEEQLAILVSKYGEPERTVDPAWYPGAEIACCWRRDDRPRVLCLLLTRLFEGKAVSLWSFSDAERTQLIDADQTRAARIASRESVAEHVDKVIAILNDVGPEFLATKILIDDLRAAPRFAEEILRQRLESSDAITRLIAAELTLQWGGGRVLDMVRPLFADPDAVVRQSVADEMASFGDDSVLDSLRDLLRQDPDPSVRGAAAGSLGLIGNPCVIPDLIRAMENDQEVDPLGYTPGSISATALDNLLGTNHTRIQHEDGFCSMAPYPPRHDELKAAAMACFEEWKSKQPKI